MNMEGQSRMDRRELDTWQGWTLYRRSGFLMVESPDGDADYLDLIDADSDLFCYKVEEWQNEYSKEIEYYND